MEIRPARSAISESTIALPGATSRALADDPDSSASDASRAMGAAARDAPSGALDESDSFDV